MLFDVAAVLSTSVAIGLVAEAFGVHEIDSYDTAVVLVLDSAAIPAGQPLPDTQPLPGDGFAPGGPASVSPGSRLLQRLSMLSAADIPRFIAADQAAVPAILADPPVAAGVASWWGGLDAEHRATLIRTTPQLVGNLDGIPLQVRDAANRSMLTSTMTQLRDVIATEGGRTVIENAKMQLRMLESISGALGEQAAGSARTLMSLDVTGQGKAAIVIGDLQEADYVTYMVPGMFFAIEGQMGYWTDAAARLGDEQRSWLALLGEDADADVATVAWIGYQTPNLTNVASIDNALEGRDLLAGAVTGLQALRGDDQPYITIIGHSYGSTAALMAVTDYDLEVDALVVVGSPGSPAKSVDELHVRGGNVYVGEAPWDAVPDSAFFGSDPGADGYGARSFGTAGGIDPITHEALLGSFGHIEYFSPGTESLRNLALIAIGEGEHVTESGGIAPTRVRNG